MMGTPAEEFNLVFNGKVLGLWHTLKDFNIQKESTIHLAPNEIYVVLGLVQKGLGE